MSLFCWGLDVSGDKWRHVTVKGATADNLKLLRHALCKKHGRSVRITRKEYLSLFGISKRQKMGSRIFLNAAEALMGFKYSYDDGDSLQAVNVLSGIQWSTCRGIIHEIVFFFDYFTLGELNELLSHKNEIKFDAPPCAPVTV